MDKELSIGKSYTAQFLLEFLSENCNRNVVLESKTNTNLLEESRRETKFTISKIHTTYLHSMRSNPPGSYVINNDFTIYLITPEMKE